MSFDENETGYKSFKSAIEGDVKPQPENVMICVTSNRRSIVKEVWNDRVERDDVHVNDTIQEKRSLADRFGVAVNFSAPNQREYLNIVKGLAIKANLDIDESTLTEEALRWELRHSGRSGRTARQFINHLSRHNPQWSRI